jgi:hypothetical protein
MFDAESKGASMRTTMTIDDDVLAAVRGLAEQQRRSIGEVISDLSRQALRRPAGQAERNGVPLLPVSNVKAQVTLDVVNALRDETA